MALRPLALAVAGLASIWLVACGGSTGTDTRGAADAALSTVDSGAAQCACVEVIISSSDSTLCDCPVIQYGCQSAPQTFERVCDVAPPCWRVETDPITGCPMPAYDTAIGNPSCSCVQPQGADAGTAD